MGIIAKGIDVSTFQNTIDWKKVKADGIQFAMIRGGYGRRSKDEKFETNYKNAKAAKVPIGVYHYSYADTVDKAKEEAEFVISCLKGKKLEYPVAFDIEDTSLVGLSKTLLTNITKAFCETVEKAGYYVCIYTNIDWTRNHLNMKKLSAYDVWIAQWNSKCTYTGEYGLWQYSDKGKVSGISGRVDMDYAYKDYPTIIKNAGLNGFKKTSSSAKPNNSTTEKPSTAKPSTKPSASKPTASKPAAKPKTYTKGEAIKLENAALYSSATDKVVRSRKTGTYFIYDGEEINGRYRVTFKKTFCGRKPIGIFVTGWVAKSNLK